MVVAESECDARRRRLAAQVRQGHGGKRPRIAASRSEERVDCSLQRARGGSAAAWALDTHRSDADVRRWFATGDGRKVSGRARDTQATRVLRGALDVALNLLPRARDKKLDLNGQVLSHSDAELGSFSVQLLQSETERAITATDDLGGFAIESIPPGVYELVLSSERVEVSIKPVELNV